MRPNTARYLVDLLVEGVCAPMAPPPNQIPILVMQAHHLLPATEAWSNSEKEKVLANAKSMDYRLVDHCIEGDYDLVLWHTDKVGDAINAYVASINNAGHDPLSDRDQLVKYTDTAGKLPMAKIVVKLTEWVGKHGSIIVGSIIPERNSAYLQLLKKKMPGFKFAPWNEGDYRYGFSISK
jgi:hypothetical protein